MRCFQCDLEHQRFETIFASKEIPDKYKTHCFHCKGQLSQRELHDLLQVECSLQPRHVVWTPPPMPPTKAEAERRQLEREALQAAEEAERVRLEWEEQHETTSFNILVKPPILFGGSGEMESPLIPRIFSSSINDLERLNDTLPIEYERQAKRRELEFRKKNCKV